MPVRCVRWTFGMRDSKLIRNCHPQPQSRLLNEESGVPEIQIHYAFGNLGKAKVILRQTLNKYIEFVVHP